MEPIDDNYITVKGWMTTRLNLKGRELLAFALVYGFSQDGRSAFRGSLRYVQQWLGCSKPTAIAVLDSLVKSGLLIRKDGKSGSETNTYRANLEVVKKLNQGGKETLPVGVKKFNHTGKETLPDIYIDNIDNKIEREPARENSTFHVQVHSLETLSDPPASDPAPPAHFDTPDWMEVARQMYEYSRGEGKAQYDFLANTMRFHGDPMPIFANWAGKASPYQLRTWKREFPKLGMWFRNEAQRPNNSPAAAPASVPAPRIKNPHL